MGKKISYQERICALNSQKTADLRRRYSRKAPRQFRVRAVGVRWKTLVPEAAVDGFVRSALVGAEDCFHTIALVPILKHLHRVFHSARRDPN